MHKIKTDFHQRNPLHPTNTYSLLFTLCNQLNLMAQWLQVLLVNQLVHLAKHKQMSEAGVEVWQASSCLKLGHVTSIPMCVHPNQSLEYLSNRFLKILREWFAGFLWVESFIGK